MSINLQQHSLRNKCTNCVNAAVDIYYETQKYRKDHISPLLKKVNLRLDQTKLAEIGKIGIGIESGSVEVVCFERGNESEVTVIGSAVNIASRIINTAEPGEIWIGQNARGDIGGVINVGEEKEME